MSWVPSLKASVQKIVSGNVSIVSVEDASLDQGKARLVVYRNSGKRLQTDGGTPPFTHLQVGGEVLEIEVEDREATLAPHRMVNVAENQGETVVFSEEGGIASDGVKDVEDQFGE